MLLFKNKIRDIFGDSRSQYDDHRCLLKCMILFNPFLILFRHMKLFTCSDIGMYHASSKCHNSLYINTLFSISKDDFFFV